jgi:hypothetical protein
MTGKLCPELAACCILLNPCPRDLERERRRVKVIKRVNFLNNRILKQGKPIVFGLFVIGKHKRYL